AGPIQLDPGRHRVLGVALDLSPQNLGVADQAGVLDDPEAGDQQRPEQEKLAAHWCVPLSKEASERDKANAKSERTGPVVPAAGGQISARTRRAHAQTK